MLVRVSQLEPKTKELRDVVKYDENSTLYTAKRTDGKIVLINPIKSTITIISI